MSESVTNYDSSDRTSLERTMEAAVRRLIGAGIATAARFKTSIRVGGGTHTALDGGSGRIIADGAAAAIFVYDQGGTNAWAALSRTATVFQISTSEGAAITFNSTTGIITPAATAVSVFSNLWSNFGAPYGNASYWLDAHGVVHLEGVIKSGTMTATAFTLPAGFRPISQADFPMANNGAVGEVLVKTDGTVVPFTGTNGFVSLSGITFRTV
jgi:hypothetical protein